MGPPPCRIHALAQQERPLVSLQQQKSAHQVGKGREISSFVNFADGWRCPSKETMATWQSIGLLRTSCYSPEPLGTMEAISQPAKPMIVFLETLGKNVIHKQAGGAPPHTTDLLRCSVAATKFAKNWANTTEQVQEQIHGHLCSSTFSPFAHPAAPC